MKLKNLGKNTSVLKVEVQSVSQHGVWLFVQDREFFLSYDSYPWFKEAQIKEIYNVEFLHEKHLRWPDLDIDLHLDSLIQPEQYPLKYSVIPSQKRKKKKAP